MELISIVLTSLVTAISPVGLIIDQTLESQLRSQLNNVDTLQVRVDNTPSYRVLQGKVQRIRIASEGISITPQFHLDSFMMETDPIAVDLNQLTSGEINSLTDFQNALEQPFKAAFQVGITESELNTLLNAPSQKALLENTLQKFANQISDNGNQRYELLHSEVTFLGNQRFAIALKLRIIQLPKGETESIQLRFESGLVMEQGKRLAFIEPRLTVNENPLPQGLVKGVTKQASKRFNLSDLEQELIARILELKIEQDKLKLAAFIKLSDEIASE